MLRDLWSDVRHAVRLARRTPVVSMALALAIALGIGGTTAIVSVMEGVFLKHLPFPRPEELVRVGTSMRTLGVGPEVNALDARDWVALSRSLRDIGTFDVEDRTLRLAGGDSPVSATALLADPRLAAVLGLRPALGRGFLASDFSRGATPVVVLGRRFWREAFGADATVVGRTIGLDAARATIVGVWPDAADRFPAGGADFWTPLTYPPDSFLNQRGSIALSAVARLAPGVGLDAARADLAIVAHRLAMAYPETNTGRSAVLDPLQDAMVGPVRPMMILIAASIATVLAVACANIANLLLAQAFARTRELAVRTSLGATRGRLVRQLLAESLTLFAVAGAAGVAVAPAIAGALVRRYPSALPLAADIALDPRVLAIAVAVTFGAGLIAGLPRLRALARPDVAADLSEGARGLVSRTHRRLARLLIVAQVAISVVLLFGALSLLRTFVTLAAVSPGLQASHLVTMRVTLPAAALGTPERTLAFQEGVRDLASTLPGVERAAHAMFLPFAPGSWHDGFERVGKADARPNLPMADFFMVSPEYLGALGIPIRRGRDLAKTDTGGAPEVVVVSETFAARTFPGEPALGRRLRWEDRTWEIVGIAADSRHGSLWEAPDPDVYVPRGQKITDNTWLVVRTGRPANALAAELRARLRPLDPAAALTDVRTMNERLSESVAPERFRALLTGSLGCLALVLAAVGVYGVVSYAVARTTREIGIRMALGQSRGSVVGRILAGTLTTTACGVVVGLASAVLAGRWLEASLPDVHGSEPGTMLAVASIFFAVATLAAAGPALRASRVDLVDALRAE